MVINRRTRDGQYEVIGFYRLAGSLKQQRSSVSIYPTLEEAEVAHDAFKQKVTALGWTLVNQET